MDFFLLKIFDTSDLRYSHTQVKLSQTLWELSLWLSFLQLKILVLFFSRLNSFSFMIHINSYFAFTTVSYSVIIGSKTTNNSQNSQLQVHLLACSGDFGRHRRVTWSLTDSKAAPQFGYFH